MQDAEEDVGHLGVAVAPVMAVLQPYIRAASDKRGQVLRQVSGAGAGTVEHDRASAPDVTHELVQLLNEVVAEAAARRDGYLPMRNIVLDVASEHRVHL